MHNTTFEYLGQPIRLFYEIEVVRSERVLTLLDVRASSEEAVESVPDWRIEYEAMLTADAHDAKYT